jgi:uncharacterized protein (DUF1330 family)
MPAYWIVRIDVTDPKQFSEYSKRSPEIIARFGGRYLVRGGETVSLEGPEEKRRVVVVEFPSLEIAQKCYQSLDYQEARKFRLGAATGEIIMVAGVA